MHKPPLTKSQGAQLHGISSRLPTPAHRQSIAWRAWLQQQWWERATQAAMEVGALCIACTPASAHTEQMVTDGVHSEQHMLCMVAASVTRQCQASYKGRMGSEDCLHLHIPIKHGMYGCSISDETVPSKLQGKYGAFALATSAGVKHLKSLQAAGLTHIHLLPAYDIGSIPERTEDQATVKVCV